MDPNLTPAQRRLLDSSRRATLATIDPRGRPRLVPICFVVGAGSPLRLFSPIDEKPKSTGDPMRLARVRDILARPDVTILVDRWDEDWSRLGWLRLGGTARILEPGDAEHGPAVAALRAKYPQYLDQRLEGRPIIRVTIERATSWGDLG
jgi:PPOX class probable F420-dependent enzyme